MRARLDEVAHSLGRDPVEVVAVADALGLGLFDMNSRLDDRSVDLIRAHYGRHGPDAHPDPHPAPGPGGGAPSSGPRLRTGEPPVRFVGSSPPVGSSTAAPEGVVRLPGAGPGAPAPTPGAPPPPAPPTPDAVLGPGPTGGGARPPGSDPTAAAPTVSTAPARRRRALAGVAALVLVAAGTVAATGIGRGTGDRATGVTDQREFCARMAFTDDFFGLFVAAFSPGSDDADRVVEVAPAVRDALRGAAAASKGEIRSDVEALGDYVEFLIDIADRPEVWGTTEGLEEAIERDEAIAPIHLRLLADRAEACPIPPGVGG